MASITEPTTDYLLQQAVEHPDYQARREYAYQLYQRGLREGIHMANAANLANIEKVNGLIRDAKQMVLA